MLQRRARSPTAGGPTRSGTPSTCACPARAARSDCPVGVDMATYKAEFLHQPLPAAGCARARTTRWAGCRSGRRLAARAPRLANALTRPPRCARAASGRRDRPAPRRSRCSPRQTFSAGSRRRDRGAPAAPATVLLWPDTFTNHFTPEVGAGRGARCWRHAGLRVDAARRAGVLRPDLDLHRSAGPARRVLRRTLDALAPVPRAGRPDGRPGTELHRSVPLRRATSCSPVTPGRPALRRSDPDARRAAGSAGRRTGDLPAGWTARRSPRPLPPARRRSAATPTTGCWRRAGVDNDRLDSGCCGLAGNFGFERGHYDVSVQVGENVLLPALREAPEETIVLADGFSCRTQISQLSPRRPVHLAEVLRDSIRSGGDA